MAVKTCPALQHVESQFICFYLSHTRRAFPKTVLTSCFLAWGRLDGHLSFNEWTDTVYLVSEVEFGLLIFCMYSLPCPFVFRNDLSILLYYLATLLRFTLKIKCIESIIQVSIMLACVLLSAHCSWAKTREGGFPVHRTPTASQAANEGSPTLPRTTCFSLSQTCGHSQTSFLWSLGVRDNPNLRTSQPQRDIYERAKDEQYGGPMNKCAPIDKRCLLKDSIFSWKSQIWKHRTHSFEEL